MAGRPTIGKEKRAKVSVMIDPAQHAYLRAFGDGNVSAAIYAIVERSMAQHARKYRNTRPVRRT